MNKEEFLKQLRETLQDEMPSHIVDGHIKYYSDYIESCKMKQESEENIVNQIGDPRLIAKTIIDTYKMSGRYKYGGWKQNRNNAYEEVKYEEYEGEEGTGRSSKPRAKGGSEINKNRFFERMRRIITYVAFILVLVIVIKFAVQLLFSVILPIILIYLLIKVFLGVWKRR
ncbi:DUF1700 domain-containing protein [Anaeromicropila populeti]|uniref:DUF1700 domain-containing protein n=1 Tax=Anaeromicropila populeti TaxID=37658 RepID=A0A1I6K0Z8_9FIRM|nr:DUF1700 domain-containing protein [Anaeromicropila populeti]SFR84909.1 Protein of unknown function [Anaeromicropila populeti]